jgi:hypothetical protein
MRRRISLALLTVFSWMLIVPFLGPDAEATLPPCCRRNGKHHCAMCLARQSDAPGFATISEKCPCQPVRAGAVHSPTYKQRVVEDFSAAVVCHRTGEPQGQALYRLCFLRDHHKRGPPTPLAKQLT